MAYKQKTQYTDASVEEFIESVENPKKREDAYQLLDLFTEASGFEAKMWGPSIIGFGSYHYKYESGHEGDAPIVGFSPRKAKISLYIFDGVGEEEIEILDKMGKYTYGKACVYVNKLTDIDTDILKGIVADTTAYYKEKYK